MSTPTSSATSERTSQQLLHLVFGGELNHLDGITFADVAKLDIVGIYPNYAEAHKAWKGAAQKTVRTTGPCTSTLAENLHLDGNGSCAPATEGPIDRANVCIVPAHR